MNALQDNDSVTGVDELVLVVDDDPALRMLIASVLRRRGYTVIEAAQADEAFQLACAEAPSLVVSDVLMGSTTGLELLARLRAHVDTADISVILMSGAQSDSGVRHNRLMGADDYLEKPFRIDDLCRTVEAQLHKRKRSKEPETKIEGRLLAILDATTDLVGMVDIGTGRTLYLNQAGRTMLGIPAGYQPPEDRGARAFPDGDPDSTLSEAGIDRPVGRWDSA